MSVERMGVSTIEKIINKMGMIFREQPTDDYGIDAQIEIVEDNYPTGKLIGVQIKSGESFFSETTDNGIVFRGERRHYDYWLNHSLPVIIVLYSPEKDICCWNIVNSETAKPTGKKWKIEIPFRNLLENAKPQLIKIADNLTEYEKRFNTFLLAKPWMNEIINGNKVVLTVGEWINKSSGKGDFKLKILDKFGSEKQVFNTTFWGFGLRNYVEVIKALFPWATVSIDYDFYTEYDEEALENEDFSAANVTYTDSVGAYFDREKREYIFPKDAPSIEEWMKDSKNIRPYCIIAGEVAYYQLVLELNDIARAFLLLDNFINDKEHSCNSEITSIE